MFKHYRIFALLLILLFVTVNAWMTKPSSRDWNNTLQVVLYPINADKRLQTAEYLKRLRERDFDGIENFIEAQVNRYGWDLTRPVRIVLADVLSEKPPSLPQEASGGMGVLSIMVWSLKMRYWASQQEEYSEINPDIRLFVNYFDPETTPTLQHSFGLEKGMLGVINAFADEDMTPTNNVVITHELLHTLGASDKYDSKSNQPLYPRGYADAEQHPLHPQYRAEIMGGRIPQNFEESITPTYLSEVTVGPETALEINWLTLDELK